MKKKDNYEQLSFIKEDMSDEEKKVCCANCRNKEMATVPFFVYEGTAYRFERSQKALIIVTVIALVLSLAIIIGAIFVLKLLSDIISLENTKDVVSTLVNSTKL